MHAAGIGEGLERPADARSCRRWRARSSPCPLTLTMPEASAREAPRPSMPRPSMVQVRAAWSKASVASPRNTATVGPNFTRTEPRHSPSPWSGDSVAPGMHEATSAGSLSSGQTSSAGSAIVVCLAECRHGYAASRCWISSCMMVVRQWMRCSSMRIAAAGLVQPAAIVPDHDVADAPLVLVLRRGRDHVGRELLDQRVAVGLAQALDAHDVVGIGIERGAAGLLVLAHHRIDGRRPLAVLRLQQIMALALLAAIDVFRLQPGDALLQASGRAS